MTQMPDDFTISQLSKAVQADDLERVRAMLQSRPDLVNMDAGDRGIRFFTMRSINDRRRWCGS
jgi:hypothetical protein